MNALQLLRQKVSSHQRGSSPSKLSAHQVSYLATSGGDSKRGQHVSGSGWRRLSSIMDSGSAASVAPEDIAKSIPVVETEASRQGQCHHDVLRDWWPVSRAVPDHRCDPTTQLRQSCM